MVRSLLIKGALLAATIAAVLWIGWPAPKETPSQVEPNQPMTVQARTGPASGSAQTPSKIDLNRAGVDELTLLPGVGPVLAQRMVEWRKAHGRYRSVDDLQAVKGIGKKRMEQLRPLVIVKT